MHAGSGKAGLSQMSSEALAEANLDDLKRRPPSRGPSLRLTLALIGGVVIVWGIVELLA